MSNENVQLKGPDLSAGVGIEALSDGAMLTGHVAGESALLVRRGNDLFAIGAACTHYGGPLAKGLLLDETLRCPWHHACFNLCTGEPLRAPALDPLPRWRVEVSDGVAFVREKLAPESPATLGSGSSPKSILIIGGGAAGNAAAETLRHEGYGGPITMLSADSTLPCDRPNLSKDYLAGKAPEEWTLLRSDDFYKRNDIDVQLNARVSRIDTCLHEVQLVGGAHRKYGTLLLATGAEPVRLTVPGAERSHVHYLRTLEDSRALVEEAKTARRVVVVGASFIGLEVASSLRARGIEVHVVGPEAIPMARILGAELGLFIRSVHEQHGVIFHLGRAAATIDEGAVILSDGTRIDADMVVIGIGVRPATTLAEQAGLAIDRGVVVDEYLKTSAPDVFAAGDIARWPDRRSGARIRVEHFVVAERQGQTAGRNMLGLQERFDAVPFFWTEQHDLGIAYVGHAEDWDEVKIDGSIEDRNCSVTYLREGRKLAVAVIHRDLEGLRAEVEFERSGACPGLSSAARELGEVAGMNQSVRARNIRLKRIYERASADDGTRILVDRLWPRGITKTEAKIDEWNREITPSGRLRAWFGHDPERWTEFSQRYRAELAQHADALGELRRQAREGPITLLYAAKDEAHTHAIVLRNVLLGRSTGEGETP